MRRPRTGSADADDFLRTPEGSFNTCECTDLGRTPSPCFGKGHRAQSGWVCSRTNRKGAKDAEHSRGIVAAQTAKAQRTLSTTGGCTALQNRSWNILPRFCFRLPPLKDRNRNRDRNRNFVVLRGTRIANGSGSVLEMCLHPIVSGQGTPPPLCLRGETSVQLKPRPFVAGPERSPFRRRRPALRAEGRRTIDYDYQPRNPAAAGLEHAHEHEKGGLSATCDRSLYPATAGPGSWVFLRPVGALRLLCVFAVKLRHNFRPVHLFSSPIPKPDSDPDPEKQSFIVLLADSGQSEYMVKLCFRLTP